MPTLEPFGLASMTMKNSSSTIANHFDENAFACIAITSASLHVLEKSSSVEIKATARHHLDSSEVSRCAPCPCGNGSSMARHCYIKKK
jgi:hypothetical protein